MQFRGLLVFSHVHLSCMHAQLYLTLCNPADCSLPGSSVHGILQARKLEWVAISYSHYLILEYFHHTKRNSILISNLFPSSSLSSPWQQLIHFLSLYIFSILTFSYKWNPMIYGLLSLAYYTQHNVFILEFNLLFFQQLLKAGNEIIDCIYIFFFCCKYLKL